MEQQPSGAATPWREIATDALRYWEPRRLVYNGVLTAIVVGFALLAPPNLASTGRVPFHPGMLLSLFVLAVLANVCYSTAYVVDAFVQLSTYRERWRSQRWLLFLLGLVLACALTIGGSLTLFYGD